MKENMCSHYTNGNGWVALSTGFITKLKCSLLMLFILQDIVRGQDWGPRYRTTPRSCSSDDQCDTSLGQVCWWSYDGCAKGECRCNPQTHFLHSGTGRCERIKLGDEECDAQDKCPEGMSCHNGKCRCDIGIMTSDKSFCLRTNDKLLGEKCDGRVDRCYQRSAHGYKKMDTQCKRGLCTCKSGYKEDGGSCRKWDVGEPGCGRDHHCQGGALCIDNVCQCPSGYMPSASGKKCAKQGAKYDLKIGATCDELDERRYCGEGLVCHRCAGELEYTCVRFIQAQALPYGSDDASVSSLNIFTLVVATITSFLLSTLR